MKEMRRWLIHSQTEEDAKIGEFRRRHPSFTPLIQGNRMQTKNLSPLALAGMPATAWRGKKGKNKGYQQYADYWFKSVLTPRILYSTFLGFFLLCMYVLTYHTQCCTVRRKKVQKYGAEEEDNTNRKQRRGRTQPVPALLLLLFHLFALLLLLVPVIRFPTHNLPFPLCQQNENYFSTLLVVWCFSRVEFFFLSFFFIPPSRSSFFLFLFLNPPSSSFVLCCRRMLLCPFFLFPFCLAFPPFFCSLSLLFLPVLSLVFLLCWRLINSHNLCTFLMKMRKKSENWSDQTPLDEDKSLGQGWNRMEDRSGGGGEWRKRGKQASKDCYFPLYY